MSPSDINTILQRLAVIETKVDQLVGIGSDHEVQIRGLVRWRWLTTGFAAAAGAGVAKLTGLA